MASTGRGNAKRSRALVDNATLIFKHGSAPTKTARPF